MAKTNIELKNMLLIKKQCIIKEKWKLLEKVRKQVKP